MALELRLRVRRGGGTRLLLRGTWTGSAVKDYLDYRSVAADDSGTPEHFLLQRGERQTIQG